MGQRAPIRLIDLLSALCPHDTLWEHHFARAAVAVPVIRCWRQEATCILALVIPWSMYLCFLRCRPFGLQNWKPKLCGHGICLAVSKMTWVFSCLFGVLSWQHNARIPANAGSKGKVPFKVQARHFLDQTHLLCCLVCREFSPPAGKKKQQSETQAVWATLAQTFSPFVRHSFDIPAKTLEAPGIWLSQPAAALAPVLSLLGTFGRGPKTRPSKGGAADNTWRTQTQNKFSCHFERVSEPSEA